ncbi:YybS family protein [Alkalicoccus daliensis]|uniref:Uncharacterized conserved protein YybS, DUF2232 family n=1 Tax=Alkalicoccus daliensis TaxID=745820 RepID=A0A1H0FQA3_9BACI|nr:DUF2232 domain-containing protein [Alkalicoccus daliensis]SDN96721.1 Uncharacterized conserved protein YybS, DUF2232 family [Alkalicoccus daliensis]
MEQSSIIRDGLLASAAFLALVLLALFIPFAALLLVFFLPLPLVRFTYNYGWLPGSILGLSIFFLLFLILGPFAPAIMLLFGISGIVIGELFRRNEKAFGVYAGAALSIIGGLVLTYVGFMAFTDTDPIVQLQSTLEDSLGTTEDILGTNAEEDTEAIEQMMNFIDNISVIVPAILVFTGAAAAFLTQLAAARWLRSRGEKIVKFPPLRKWSLPKSFIWYYLFALILSFINAAEGETGVINTLSSNLMPVLGSLMILQGISFLFFYFHLKKLSIILPIMITFSLVVFPFMLPIIRILGIIDLGFDLRTRLKSQK